MGFFSDIFNRTGRVARGQANQAVSALEDATFEATLCHIYRIIFFEII